MANWVKHGFANHKDFVYKYRDKTVLVKSLRFTGTAIVKGAGETKVTLEVVNDLNGKFAKGDKTYASLSAIYIEGPEAPASKPTKPTFTYKKKEIPDWPKKCGFCGGGAVQLFLSDECQNGCHKVHGRVVKTT